MLHDRTRIRYREVLGALLGCAIQACSGEPGRTTQVISEYELDGVRVVQVDPWFGTDLRQWTIEEEPAIEIGEIEGEDPYLLTRVVGSARLSDGRLVVFEGVTQELRFYDAEGAFLFKVGGRGEGPGEFRAVDWLARSAGDTVLVWDGPAHRLTRFDAAGRLLEAERLHGPMAHHRPGLLLDDGSRLLPEFYEQVPSPPPGNVWRPEAHLVRVDQRSGAKDTLGIFRGREQLVGALGISLPAPREFHLASGRPTRTVAVGDSERFEVRMLDPDGLERARIVSTQEPEELPAYHLAEWESLVQEHLRGQPWEADAIGAVRGFNNRARMPTFSDLAVDSEGNVWIFAFELQAAKPREAVIFSRHGSPLARAELPGSTQVLEIGVDYVLLLATDTLGVVSVRQHRILRGSDRQ